MPYPALPDRRIPYDADGTLVYTGSASVGASTALTTPQTTALQDMDLATAAFLPPSDANARVYLFLPHQSSITAIYGAHWSSLSPPSFVSITGSNDTTNGEDGTWETASLPGGNPPDIGSAGAPAFDRWRSQIKAVSFTGAKKNVRVTSATSGDAWQALHMYGEVAAGQMAHDLIFIDQDAATPAEFAAPEDFGDQPLGATVVRQFRIKNTSASRTATNIALSCNDPDFTIATSAAGPWVTTINITSLAAGAESATLFVRCTTPAPGAALLPRFSRIAATADAGFFG